jgi:hypothetical protein
MGFWQRSTKLLLCCSSLLNFERWESCCLIPFESHGILETCSEVLLLYDKKHAQLLKSEGEKTSHFITTK